MTLDALHQEVKATVGAETDFFLDLAEHLTAEYQEDNAIGDPADPSIFVSWLATALRQAQLAGIDVAFQAVAENQTAESGRFCDGR